MHRILGIDPGLQHTGWGIIEVNNNNISFVASGTIHSSPKKNISDRLLELNNGINKVLDSYQIDEAAIEETFVNKNALSSLKLGHARGALMLTLSLVNLPVFEYSATKVKKTVVGVGRAEKVQIEMMVKQILPSCEFDTSDASDALAVAICHFNHRNISYLIA